MAEPINCGGHDPHEGLWRPWCDDCHVAVRDRLAEVEAERDRYRLAWFSARGGRLGCVLELRALEHEINLRKAAEARLAAVEAEREREINIGISNAADCAREYIRAEKAENDLWRLREVVSAACFRLTQGNPHLERSYVFTEVAGSLSAAARGEDDR